MLDVIGLNPFAETVYEELIRRPDRTAADLADQLGADTAVALKTLSDLGLVRGPDEEGRYAASPPDIALAGLTASVDHRLSRARLRITELTALHASTVAAGDAQVETVPAAEAASQFERLFATATSRVRTLEAPPYSESSADDDPWPPEMAALARGVQIRVVYGRAAMETQNESLLAEPIAAGEQARVIDEVPLRMTLVDDEFAMLPTQTGRMLSEGLLIVRPGALLDALSSLFESVWAQALPITLGSTIEGMPGDETLIALLAAGLGDAAIARHLGIGLRTVQRRVSDLLRTLHVTSRFQAGVAVGRRVPGPGPDNRTGTREPR